MTRYAVGDIQGCCREFRELLAKLSFSADKDQLWLVGDLVNRGPESLSVLRLARSLSDNAVIVLGNHDLHLLAVAHGSRRKRRSDTLDDILQAPDRDSLLDWLITRPLAHAQGSDLLVHAGLVPNWTAATALALAREVEAALRANPRELFDNMYGDEPDVWSDALTGTNRLRFAINVLTRLRVCTAEGRVDLKMKGKPHGLPPLWRPWFDHDNRRSRDARIVFGHWSALGLIVRADVLGLDSGCVWGGALTAIDLDDVGRPPIAVACTGYQSPDGE